MIRIVIGLLVFIAIFLAVGFEKMTPHAAMGIFIPTVLVMFSGLFAMEKRGQLN